MKRYITLPKIIVTVFVITIILSCSEKPKTIPESNLFNTEIDTYLSDLIKADQIPGMAVAVIQKGKVIHKKNYGLGNIEHNVPVSDSTLFRVYSVSKLITSVAVFQLIEKGKLSLEDSISKYIDDLPQSWQDITIAHLLTHSSGLPEYKEETQGMSDKELLLKIFDDTLQFEKGNRFKYNQTNFWFLKRIIEKVTQQKFHDYCIENQFSEVKKQAIYASNSLLAIPNRTPKYKFDKKNNAYEITTHKAGERSHAGNGLNVTLNALIKWNAQLDQNILITEKTKTQMMTAYEYQGKNTPFGYSWGIYGPEDKQYYGFAGGGVGAFMKFIDKDITIIILSNGFKNRPIISNAITYISGVVDSSLVRKDRMLNEEVRLAFLLNTYDEALKTYQQKKRKNPEINFERALNEMGYYFLSINKTNNAIALFEMNTKENPKSANAYDSLGEAYFLAGNNTLALTSYKKSVKLNPKNENAQKWIEVIEKNR
ncbi:serine hydrolase domain-containing protein [Aquimarina sp. I32.4]|uniref:serine hydrolase domain-containing protein n=1 Tax=Aquimarina sp. I32.4 TaxID=2053903 RepID=UPI000CDEF0B3|nr:serine hydrolase domain-containing protein [Aquimarina sp. I32.4]